MRFDQDFIEKVRESNNLIDIISRYTQLKGAGNRHTGLCPFPNHNEKTPSFSVSEGQQLYHCFGCKKSGNIFHFVQEMQGLSFVESVEYLAQKASIPMPVQEEQSPQLTKYKNSLNSSWKLIERSADYYFQNLQKLPESHPAKQYCRKRNLTDEVINEFKIGFAHDQWDGLLNFLNKIKAPQSVGQNLGLLKKRKSGDGLYDQYRNRLMFPIITQTEKYVGFGGRVLDDSLPKYINSAESSVFKKSQIFYGLNQSAKYIRTKGYAIVVEGYMDFLALYAKGVRNVVATLGTALTPQHAKLIGRYTSKLIILFDGDKAGQAAAQKSLKVLLEAQLLPRSVILPDNMDPDDFIAQKGADEFQRVIAASEDLFLIVMQDKLKNFKGAATEKVAVMEELAPLMRSVKHLGLKELYLRELSDRLQVTEDWLLKMINASGKNEKPSLQEPKNTDVTDKPVVKRKLLSLAKAPKHELYLINMALKSTEYFDKIIEQGVIEQISDQNLLEVFKRAEQVYRQSPEEFDKLTALLVTQIDQPTYLSAHLAEPLSTMDNAGSLRLIDDCVKKIRKQSLKAQTLQLLKELKQDSSKKEKLEQIMNIQKGKLNL